MLKFVLVRPAHNIHQCKALLVSAALVCSDAIPVVMAVASPLGCLVTPWHSCCSSIRGCARILLALPGLPQKALSSLTVKPCDVITGEDRNQMVHAPADPRQICNVNFCAARVGPHTGACVQLIQSALPSFAHTLQAAMLCKRLTLQGYNAVRHATPDAARQVHEKPRSVTAHDPM